MSLSPKKERAILEWVNCLSIGDTIESLEELMDGKLFLHIVNLMEKQDFPQPDNIKERFCLVANFLDDYYQTSTNSLIRYHECPKGRKFELAKIAVLLLSALVLLNISPSSQHIIIPLTNLDESIQNEIHECLEAVLLNQNGLKLSAEFVTVLSHQVIPTELNSNGSAVVYENSTPVLQNPLKRFQLRNRLPFTITSPSSPLREFFDSPQLAAKAAAKEMASLRSRLLSEQLRTTELETELRKLHDNMNKKAKEEQELRKIIAELRQYRDKATSLEEYQILAEQQGIKIEKLLSCMKELEDYKIKNSSLEIDNENLRRENEDLEQNIKNIDNLHKTNGWLSQENSTLIEKLNKVEHLNIDYENQISCLQQDLQLTRKELEYLQQLNKEKTDLTKVSNSSSEDYDSGECLLTAFTEIELSELKCQFSELQKELEEKKEENRKIILKNGELVNTIDSLRHSIQKVTNEKSKLEENFTTKFKLQEEENKSLSKTIEILETTSEKLKTDWQKVKEENTNLQCLIDCLEKTTEKLYQKIDSLSNENNNIQQSYAQCSEQLVSTEVQLKSAIHSCDIWKQKNFNLEVKYNNAVTNHCTQEAALLSNIKDMENMLKTLIAEKESIILSANASKLSMENTIHEKERILKEQGERDAASILRISQEKDSINKDLNESKKMLNQLEDKKQLLEKELNDKIDNLVFEKENILSALKEVQLCYNKKVKEIEEKTLTIESISHEKENLKDSIGTLEEVKKSLNSTIEELSSSKKSLEEKLIAECSNLKIAKETYQEEIDKSREIILALETKQSHLEKEKEELTRRLKELDVKFQNLEKNAEEIVKERELYQSSCHSLQDDFDKLTFKLNEVEEEKCSLEEDIKDLHKDYKDQLQHSLTNNQELKKVITELNSTLDLKDQEIVDWKTLLDKENQKHKTEIYNLNQMLESIHSDVIKANLSLDAANAKHKMDINYLNKEMNEKEKIILEFRKELHIKDLEVNKAGALKNKIELLENEHQKLIEKLEDVERKLRGCKEAKEMAEKEYYMCVEQKEKDKEDLRNQLDLLQKERRIQNQSCEGKIVDLNNYIEVITKTSEETINLLRNEINLLKNENSNLLLECNSVKSKIIEIDLLQAEIESLNSQVKDLTELNEKKELLYTSAVENLKSEKQLFTDKKKLSESEIALLKSEILEKCHLLSSKDEIIASKNTEIDELKEEIHTAKLCENKLTNVIAEKEIIYSTLTKDMQETKMQKENIESELMKLKEEMYSFQQNNKSLNEQLENLENSIIKKDICIKKLSFENECLQEEIKELNKSVDQLKANVVTSKIKSEENIFTDKRSGNNNLENHNKKIELKHSENVSIQNLEDSITNSTAADILERLECMIQNVNYRNKTDLLLLVEELKDKLNFSTKSKFDSNERELLYHEISDSSKELQFFNSELTKKNEELNILKISHTSKLHEMTEKSLNIEVALERKQKKLIGENLQLEVKLQNLELENEKLTLEKQMLQKELNGKSSEIENMLSQINQEQKNRKKLTDLHHEEIEKLKKAERARRNEYFQDVRKEITLLQSQVKESEQKNDEIQHKLRQERDILFKKYEGAKKLIASLQGEKKETNEKLNEERGRYREKRTQLSSAQSELEKRAMEVKVLLTQLQDEQKKLAPLQDKIKKQEALLQQEMKQKVSLKAQLELAERQIREMKQQNEAVNVFNQNSNKLYSSKGSPHDLESVSKHSKKITDEKENTVDDKTKRKSIRLSTAFFLTEIELSARNNLDENGMDPNLSTSTHFSDLIQNSMVSTPSSSIHRPFPAGTGYQFMCEDEDGEFMNHSYLGDLKAGRCLVNNKQIKRISELQRRNTLCLPHLRSSYPVETQMHASTDYTDDALKAGIAVNDSPIRTNDSNSKIPIKSKHRRYSPSPKKRKHSHSNKQESKDCTSTQHSSFHKPSFLTPNKRNNALKKPFSPSKTITQNENIPPRTPDTSRKSVFKTPSSLQKLFRRRPLRSSKETNSQNVRPNSYRFNI